MLNTLLLLVTFATLGVTLLLLHKVRRIHQGLYRLLDDAAAGRREVETLYAQLQATEGLRTTLGLAGPLPTMRGWAGSPDFLLHLARWLRKTQPTALVECSSGVSTLVAARCMQLNGHGHAWSLEHEAEYAEKTRQLLAEHGLQDWATVLHAPLINRPGETPWYDDSVLPASLPPVQALVIDGPPESTAPLARAPALPRLHVRLAPGATLFIDDADRPAEQEMLQQWSQRFPGLQLQRLPAEKGLALVTLPG